MPVTLSLNIAQNSYNSSAQTANITVQVVCSYTGGSWNNTHTQKGTLYVDGTQYSFTGDFNAGQSTSGTEIIYTWIGDVAGGSRTLSCSASLVTGGVSGTVSASKSFTITPSGSSGGGSSGGGDSGGSSGGSGSGGSSSGGGSDVGGGNEGGYTRNQPMVITQGANTTIEVFQIRYLGDGEYSNNRYAISNGDTAYAFSYFDIKVTASNGYVASYTTYMLKQIDAVVAGYDRWEFPGSITASPRVTSTATLKSYTLSIPTVTGAKITVKRTKAPNSGASIGALKNGATIYHFDQLQVTVEPEAGYNITESIINGALTGNEAMLTVTEPIAVAVTTQKQGLVYLGSDSTFEPYFVYIGNGATWDQYIPYIGTGSEWVICS